jgi:VWFA-related protein
MSSQRDEMSRIRGGHCYFLALASLAGARLAYPQPADLRVKINVDLVQVDAVVTDHEGKRVRGLTSSDFEVLLDGRPQTMNRFSYIASSPKLSSRTAPEGNGAQSSANHAPSARIFPQDPRRTIVIFVDDLSLAAESIPFVRKGVRQAIGEQVSTGDLVAIFRASAGLGALQDFTASKQLLLAAADQIKWAPFGRGTQSAYAPVGIHPEGPASESSARQSTLYEQDTTLTVLSSLQRVVRAACELPGKKSVVILSDHLPVWGSSDEKPSDQIVRSLQRVEDLANRNSVTFYGIDTRGLSSLTAQAADRIRNTNASGDPAFAAMGERREDYKRGQEGLLELSGATGGFLVPESNSISSSLARVLADQEDYYLLGFTPPTGIFVQQTTGAPAFHRISVRMTRAGLHVRSRSGFLTGDRDSDAPGGLLATLGSPFQQSGLHLRLQPIFLAGRKNEIFIENLLVFQAKDFSYSGEPANRVAVVTLMLRAFDAGGNAMPGGIDQTLKISLDEQGFGRAQKYGLVYTTIVRVPKAGPYQIRAVCRDEGTGNIGSVSELVLIQDTRRTGLALSGVVLPDPGVKLDDVVPARSSLAYHPGASVPFSLEVFEVHPESARSLKIQTSLFRDGALILEGQVKTLGVTRGRAFGRILAKSDLTIPDKLESGEYDMQVEVTEELSGSKQVKASQWTRILIGN